MNFDGDASYLHTAECDEALTFLRDEAERLQLENIKLGNLRDAVRALCDHWADESADYYECAEAFQADGDMDNAADRAREGLRYARFAMKLRAVIDKGEVTK